MNAEHRADLGDDDLAGRYPARPAGRRAARHPSALSRWCMATSTRSLRPAARARASQAEFGQPGQGLRLRPDPLVRPDLPVGHGQQRLHRQRRPEHGGRRADPPAAPQVLQAVHVEVGLRAAARRRTRSATASTSAPDARPRLRRGPRNRRAMARVPVSTTTTGTGAAAAADLGRRARARDLGAQVHRDDRLVPGAGQVGVPRPDHLRRRTRRAHPPTGPQRLGHLGGRDVALGPAHTVDDHLQRNDRDLGARRLVGPSEDVESVTTATLAIGSA